MAAPEHGNRIFPNRSFVIGVYSSVAQGTDVFVDPDGDTITYTAAGMPQGLSFYGPTQQFYGNPTSLNTVGDYKVSVTAGSIDGTDSLDFTILLLASGSQKPLYSPAYPAIKQSITLSEGSTAGNIGTPVTATSGAAVDTYAIVWSSFNSAGSAYGVNSSPFAINNSGQLSFSGSFVGKDGDHTLIVEAKKTSNGSNDVAKVVITVNPEPLGVKPVIMLDSGWQ